MQKLNTQAEWMERAQQVLPAGGFGNFDPDIIIARGEGSRVWDENGAEYVDYLIGSGPMLLGHGHPEVMEAVLEQLPQGMTFFANNRKGIELAEAIVEAVPCCEQVRFVASGGEADMYAIRLARAYTGRDKILKFEGGYHGMSAEAQMSLAPAKRVNFPQAVPDIAGIPDGVAEQMLIAPFNDLDAVAALLGAALGLHPFDNGGDTLAQADAHGSEAELAVFPFHYVQQGAGDTCARAAQWVAQCDRAAVEVDLLFHFVEQFEVFGYRQRLGSKGFV